MSVYEQRCRRLQKAMVSDGVDALLVAPSSDFAYLIGTRGHLSERLTLFVLPAKGEPALLVPQFEAPLVQALSTFFELRPWADGEDPFAIVSPLLPDSRRRIAVNDQLWSAHLLRLQALLPDAAFSSASLLIGPMRRLKDATEVDLLQRAAAAVDAVMARIPNLSPVGKSERAIARQISDLCLEHGHSVVEFTIVGSGPNSASPHHGASDRLVQNGDALVLDFGGQVGDYYSDITRTFVAGEPDVDFRRIYDTVRAAQEAAVQAVRPGVACQEIDRVARRCIAEAGYGQFFTHRTGHGLGLDVHEEPYLVEGATLALTAGMVFSVEPGIYIPGRLGVRIEDIVVVTESGGRRLNNAPRTLVALSQGNQSR